MVPELQEKDTSITVDSDLGEISELGLSTDNDNFEATDSDEEDILDLPSHVGHSETEEMQREEQSVPSPSSFPPDVGKCSFSLGLC